MKKIRNFLLVTIVMLSFGQLFSQSITGAWERMEGETKAVMVVTSGHFAIAYFKPDQFVGTMGGSWQKTGPSQVSVQIEFDSQDPAAVGNTAVVDYFSAGEKITVDGQTWNRIDDGTPGSLADAWLFTGRKPGGTGEIQTREIGPRKTMKILSGTRFQWIAYDTGTGSFSGTGGGTYTTENGKYVEKIDFFSRDNSRVGATLPFEYQVIEGVWHHQGKNSQGEPMYEVWSRRQ